MQNNVPCVLRFQVIARNGDSWGAGGKPPPPLPPVGASSAHHFNISSHTVVPTPILSSLSASHTPSSWPHSLPADAQDEQVTIGSDTLDYSWCTASLTPIYDIWQEQRGAAAPLPPPRRPGHRALWAALAGYARHQPAAVPPRRLSAVYRGLIRHRRPGQERLPRARPGRQPGGPRPRLLCPRPGLPAPAGQL